MSDAYGIGYEELAKLELQIVFPNFTYLRTVQVGQSHAVTRVIQCAQEVATALVGCCLVRLPSAEELEGELGS